VISCSDDKPKVNESLSLPEMPDRLGHTKEQIKFWHEHHLKDWYLKTDDSDLLYYINESDPDFFMSYTIRNEKVTVAAFGIWSESEKKILRNTESMLDIAEEFGFDHKIKDNDTEGKTVIILGHKSSQLLRCRITADYSSTDLITLTQFFYYASGDF